MTEHFKETSLKLYSIQSSLKTALKSQNNSVQCQSTLLQTQHMIYERLVTCRFPKLTFIIVKCLNMEILLYCASQYLQFHAHSGYTHFYRPFVFKISREMSHVKEITFIEANMHLFEYLFFYGLLNYYRNRLLAAFASFLSQYCAHSELSYKHTHCAPTLEMYQQHHVQFWLLPLELHKVWSLVPSISTRVSVDHEE